MLYAASIHFAVSSDIHFDPFYSLTLLAVLALAPFAEPWYAIFGLVAAVIPGYLTSTNVTWWLNVIFGVSAVAVALRGSHAGMPARLREFFERFGHPREAEAAAAGDVPRQRTPQGDGLQVRDLRVAFGGLVAVDGLSFSVPLGRITGLIGPNGAGKTTTFDACSGLNRRIGGQISLRGKELTRWGSSARGRPGTGPDFPAHGLVRPPYGGGERRARPRVSAGRGQRPGPARGNPVAASDTLAATWSAMDLCGITELAGTQAGALSTGQRRLVELARCLAGQFDVLILDEPSSGLDHAETEALARILRRTVVERGCGILLVEHDMSLVMNVCEYIYVLDFGALLFEGDPPGVAASPEVQAAYLGYATEAETA